MSPARVAVLLCVYNGEPHLADAVRSVLGQTFPDFELLIIDDASTDGSAATLASFDDPRIRVIRNAVNLGLTRSLNRGLAAIDSEFVARLDADDLSFPTRLERQLAFLDANPDVGVLGTQGVPIDGHGRHLRRVEWWHREWERPGSGTAMDWYRMFDTPFIHSSVMFRRTLVREVGGYDESVELAQDADLWMRLARVTRLVNLEERLVAMRLTPGSRTADERLPERQGLFKTRVRVLRAIRESVVGNEHASSESVEAWAAVVDRQVPITSGEVQRLHRDVQRLARCFPDDRFLRRHRASLVARMVERVAPQSRLLALRLLIAMLRLDPTGALLLLPRVLILLFVGDRFFRWRRARSLQRQAA
jgi:glycosyltransferase involved in cell wall biosynthesis